MTKGVGWFDWPGHPGDRSLEQQSTGLDPLFAEVAGRAVLDVGCAEGLIALRLADLGAAHVHGVDVIVRNVRDARSLQGSRAVTFEVEDANKWAPPARHYDIVLLLAVLHKLRHPEARCAVLANAASSLCVVRIARAGLQFADERSNHEPQDIGAVMRGLGFRLERETAGPHDDPTYYFRR